MKTYRRKMALLLVAVMLMGMLTMALGATTRDKDQLVTATQEPETTAEPEVTAEPEATAEPEVTAEPEATAEPETEGDYGIMPASLLPLQEAEATVDLSGYLNTELTAIPLSTVWELMSDLTIGYEQVPKPALPDKVMIAENGSYRLVNSDDTLDLSEISRLTLIVGEHPEDQLDPANTRYYISLKKVDLGTLIRDAFSPAVFDESGAALNAKVEAYSGHFNIYLNQEQITGGGTVKLTYTAPASGITLEGLYMGSYYSEEDLKNATPLTDMEFPFSDGTNQYVSLTAVFGHNGVTQTARMSVNIYQASIDIYFNPDYPSLNEGAVWDDNGDSVCQRYTWSMEDIYVVTLLEGLPADAEYYVSLYAESSEGLSYRESIVWSVVGHFDTLEQAQAGSTDITEALFDQAPASGVPGYKAIYKDGVTFTIFTAYGDVEHITVQVIDYTYDIDVRIDDLTADGVSVFRDWNNSYEDEQYDYVRTYEMNKGLDPDGKYCLEMVATSGGSSKNNVDLIEWACVGVYETLEEAKKQTDIKESLFGTSGYEADFSRGVAFTVFDITGERYCFMVKTTAYEINPNAGAWFMMRGALTPDHDTSYDTNYNCYIVDTDVDSNGDTYQTLMLMDVHGDAVPEGTTIYPVFSADEGATVYLGETTSGHIQHSGETPLVFSSGKALHYTVTPENDKGQVSYYVTFITQQSGPKLFVNGTNAEDLYDEQTDLPKRELHLADLETRYDSNNMYHDILISNVGDQELTGLKVTLEGAEYVKLDDYWTVQDSSVKTLAPLTDVIKPDNVAKIRLLPLLDENGEVLHGLIKGTLVISADGCDPVRITLTGIAGLPKITTTELLGGVKYVPYASLIQTNNVGEPDAVTLMLLDAKAPAELPTGTQFYQDGEIYGIPQESGTYYCQAWLFATEDLDSDDPYYLPEPLDLKEYELTIIENTDDNVWGASDGNYQVLDHIGVSGAGAGDPLDGTEHYILDEYAEQVFRSNGSYGYYEGFYLDGKKLADGTDYQSSEGSTVITIFSETLENAGEGTHTIAAEFHENKGSATADETPDGTLKRTAQNYTVKLKPTPAPAQPTPAAPSAAPGTQPTDAPGTQATDAPQATDKPSAQPTATPTKVQTVTIEVHVVDEQDEPVADATVELHSAPQTTVTNAAGGATFKGVEFGQHTLYAKENGKTASAAFSLASGANSSAAYNNGVVTAAPGATVRLTVRLANGELTILSAESTIPQTGDNTHIGLYLSLLTLSVLGLGLVFVRRKRKYVK